MPDSPDLDRPVLVIEDDPDHRRLIELGLEMAGLRCALCPDGDAALAWLATHTPRIIVSDWRLPGVHGQPLLDAIRRHTTAPIVLLSAYETGDRLQPDTVSAQVKKPFDMQALVDTVMRLSGTSPSSSPAPLRILLVEDNPADVDLVREALAAGTVPHVLDVLDDGEAIVERLLRGDAAPIVPDLVLLDLNLPRLDGFAVLDRLKGDPRTRGLPVVMLTTSDDPRDVDEAYRRRANAFVSKPFEIDRFIEVVQDVAAYWTTVVNPGCRAR